MALTLYHGTSVGWLMQTGFSIQTKSYGEASPPHSFIYLCTDFAGAVASARNSVRKCNERIAAGRQSAMDFAQNPNGTPAPFVYTLTFANAATLDYKKDKLEKSEADMLLRGLKSVHAECGQKTEYWARRLKFLFSTFGWQDWVEFAANEYLTGRWDDRKVEIFRRGGFKLIRNFEPNGDSVYGETVAWILPEQPVFPIACDPV